MDLFCTVLCCKFLYFCYFGFWKYCLKLRLAFLNLLNHFNWGNPGVNLNAGTFGRIQENSGDPRIMQFGVKYDF